ncbi:MAG: trypsin-like peptidase domain-containing protein [Thermoleophilia bacterium]
MMTHLPRWPQRLTALALLALLIVLTSTVLGACGTTNSSTSSSSESPTSTATPSPVPLSEFSPQQIYAQSANGVVLVVADFGNSGEALGSGFIVSTDGVILTNAHVVSDNGVDATTVRVAFRENNDQSSKQIKATLVGIDQTSDLAVLRVDPGSRTLTALPLGDSSLTVIGEWVVAIGNPLGYSFSLSAGIVSGVGRNLRAPNGAVIPNGIQTDAAINQGNSGGPLINAAGEVIGVNEQIASTSGSFSGLGFAIPVNIAKVVLDQILETGSAKHAYLGIQGQTIDPAIAQILDLPVSEGVLVEQVQSGTAAAVAGIKGGTRTEVIQGATFIVGGDIITAIDGDPVTSMEGLAATIAGKQPGDSITLTIVRDGDKQEVPVTLQERPQS